MQNNVSALTTVCTRVSGTCVKRTSVSRAPLDHRRRLKKRRKGGREARTRRGRVRRTMEAWILKIYRRENKWMNLGRGYLSEIEIYRIFGTRPTCWLPRVLSNIFPPVSKERERERFNSQWHVKHREIVLDLLISRGRSNPLPLTLPSRPLPPPPVRSSID